MAGKQQKKPEAPHLLARTSPAELAAAAAGLLLTLAVLGYSLWEGLQRSDGPPVLSVERMQVTPAAGRYVVEVKVRNASFATAAAVRVRGELRSGGASIEQREAVLDYVPGKGSAEGGLVFEHDPRAHELELTAEGFARP